MDICLQEMLFLLLIIKGQLNKLPIRSISLLKFKEIINKIT